jgi:hypothetical protein
MGAPTPVYKIKLWSTGYADDKFSLWIRARDGKCRRCGSSSKPLDCSHYWKRGDSGTRYDPLNCVAVCRDCHTIWERQQNNEYKAFMVDWLGQEEYDALERRARTFKKRVDAVLECMKLLAA